MAHHDALTGLDNRLLFQNRLTQALATGKPVAMLLLDLDHFKEVNDTLGHPVGDALLVGTAERLRAAVTPAQSVARLGGDEFAIIVVDYHSVAEVRRLARGILEATRAPHVVDGQTIVVGQASVSRCRRAGPTIRNGFSRVPTSRSTRQNRRPAAASGFSSRRWRQA